MCRGAALRARQRTTRFAGGGPTGGRPRGELLAQVSFAPQPLRGGAGRVPVVVVAALGPTGVIRPVVGHGRRGRWGRRRLGRRWRSDGESEGRSGWLDAAGRRNWDVDWMDREP